MFATELSGPADQDGVLLAGSLGLSSMSALKKFEEKVEARIARGRSCYWLY